MINNKLQRGALGITVAYESDSNKQVSILKQGTKFYSLQYQDCFPQEAVYRNKYLKKESNLLDRSVNKERAAITVGRVNRGAQCPARLSF
jgi:hypothetical protein